MIKVSGPFKNAGDNQNSLFIGPTGVGKPPAAKLAAKFALVENKKVV